MCAKTLRSLDKTIYWVRLLIEKTGNIKVDIMMARELTCTYHQIFHLQLGNKYQPNLLQSPFSHPINVSSCFESYPNSKCSDRAPKSRQMKLKHYSLFIYIIHVLIIEQHFFFNLIPLVSRKNQYSICFRSHVYESRSSRFFRISAQLENMVC